MTTNKPKQRKRTKLRAQGYRYDHEICDWVPHPKYYDRISANVRRFRAVVNEGS